VVYVPLSDGMEQIFNTVKKLKGLIKAVDFSQDYEFADLDNKENIITRNSKYFDLIFAGGKKKHKKMIKNLAGKYPERVFVLTLGRNGSISFHNNKEFFEPAKNVKVVDTTGAGDAFQASFLSTWIRTKNIKESLKIGTLYASKIIQTVRSTPGISMVII
jgi:sugar/nucleoside kinase (ribokinase family)